MDKALKLAIADGWRQAAALAVMLSDFVTPLKKGDGGLRGVLEGS